MAGCKASLYVFYRFASVSGGTRAGGNSMAQRLITRNENILGGILVFTGTRVPVKTLFDYLKANHPLDDFLEDFPTVRREQVQQVRVATRDIRKETSLWH